MFECHMVRLVRFYYGTLRSTWMRQFRHCGDSPYVFSIQSCHRILKVHPSVFCLPWNLNLLPLHAENNWKLQLMSTYKQEKRGNGLKRRPTYLRRKPPANVQNPFGLSTKQDFFFFTQKHPHVMLHHVLDRCQSCSSLSSFAHGNNDCRYMWRVYFYFRQTARMSISRKGE